MAKNKNNYKRVIISPWWMKSKVNVIAVGFRIKKILEHYPGVKFKVLPNEEGNPSLYIVSEKSDKEVFFLQSMK